MQKWLSAMLLALLCAVLWVAYAEYPEPNLLKAFHSALALAICFAGLKLAIEPVVSKKIKSSKMRYSFRKTLTIILIATSLGALAVIWAESQQALLVSFGILAAGIAISLQDVFKNLAGGLVIFTSRPYSVGERVEINGKKGDVIDIGIFYTTLMETNGWVAGDQATGRLSILPNSWVLSYDVTNYTKDHDFIWDEITVPLTYDSNWKKAAEKFSEIAKKETVETAKKAEAEISKIEEKYYFQKQEIRPSLYVSFNDNWVDISIRYPVEVKKRRMQHDRLNRLLPESIEKSRDIRVASQTYDVTVKRKK